MSAKKPVASSSKSRKRAVAAAPACGAWPVVLRTHESKEQSAAAAPALLETVVRTRRMYEALLSNWEVGVQTTARAQNGGDSATALEHNHQAIEQFTKLIQLLLKLAPLEMALYPPSAPMRHEDTADATYSPEATQWLHTPPNSNELEWLTRYLTRAAEGKIFEKKG